jgi:hypothetical protein
MQIVFAQDHAKRLNGKRITAACIAQDVAPAAGSLDFVAAAAGYGRSASRVYDNPVGMIQRRSQSRLTVTASHNFGVWPDLETDFSKQATIFPGSATREENSGAIDLFRQFGKDGSQALGRGEPKIRWRQLSLIENAKFRAGRASYSLDQCPGGFRSAAFNPEDALTGFHDSLWITAV